MNLAEDLQALAGHHVGVSDWHLLELTQLRQFQQACGLEAAGQADDTPWLPPELLLAMSAPLNQRLLASRIEARHCVNVGARAVRYGAGVAAPARIRCSSSLLQVHDKRLGRLLLELGVEIEVQGRSEPALQATTEWLLQI